MKNFFLVSVATGILSGTYLSVTAQPAVNIEQINTVTQKNTAEPSLTAALPKAVFSSSIPSNTAEEAISIENVTPVQFKYAQLLDVEVETITNRIFFEAIEKWWGTRYRYGGANEKGIDCSAYAGTIIHQVYGLVLPRTAREQYANCIKLDKEQLQQGDLVFFNTRGGISHVGIYIGNGYFTHASTSIGVTINNLSETYWSKKFIGGGRLTTPEPSE